MMHSQAKQDYLKNIFALQDEEGKVATSALADRMKVAPASVTVMVKKLAAENLLMHEPYYGVRLTREGEKMALEVIRHHRLIELFLVKKLGMSWDQVHEEAELLEHVLSEQLEDQIDASLGYPSSDPHGSAIPSRTGDLPEIEFRPLSELDPGESGVVVEVRDHDPELLRYLEEMELFPGSSVEVLKVAPFSGPLTIEVDGFERVIGPEVASNVFITFLDQEGD